MKNKIKTVIFDFDNTLFDTEKIKFALRSIILSFGFSQKEADKIYLEAREKNGEIVFCLEYFAEVLKKYLAEKKLGFRHKTLDCITKQILQGDNNIGGASELLEMCRNKKIKMYLFSLGIEKWQKEKVRASGLGKFFKKKNIIFAKEIMVGKIKIIKKIFGKKFIGEQTIMFNDKPDETAEILHEFSGLIAYIRYDERDKRYREDDFEQLKKEFGKRVTVNKSLKVLQKRLEKYFALAS
jgi:hypothetical protein